MRRRSGHYYSHPANHMWRLLIHSGIAPPSVRGPAVCPCICQGTGLLLPSLWRPWCLEVSLCYPDAEAMLPDVALFRWDC